MERLLSETYEIMNIMVAVNRKFLDPLLVMLESLFQHHKCPMRIFLLHTELTERDFARIHKLSSQHDREQELHPIYIDREQFKRVIIRFKYISIETCYRLIAVEMLPENVERLLYLDADIIVNRNLEQLYNSNFKGKAMIACRNIGVDNIKIWQKHLNVQANYFNAGVMLWNMEKVRRVLTMDVVTDMLKRSSQFQMLDQDILNILFDGDVRYARPEKFNFIVSCRDKYDPISETERYIYHFAGYPDAKPWNWNFRYGKDIWMYWKYARRLKGWVHTCIFLGINAVYQQINKVMENRM